MTQPNDPRPTLPGPPPGGGAAEVPQGNDPGAAAEAAKAAAPKKRRPRKKKEVADVRARSAIRQICATLTSMAPGMERKATGCLERLQKEVDGFAES